MGEPPPDYDKGQRLFASNKQEQPQRLYGQIPNQPYGPSYMTPPQQFGQHPQQMMMQPQMHHTTVVVNQPSVQNDRIIGSRDGHREWSSGLFSCFDDVGKCMWALCCLNCVMADISAKLGECSLLTCCVPGATATIRTRVRTLGGIRGSICKDYMAVECCYLCAVCQIHRELEYMGL